MIGTFGPVVFTSSTNAVRTFSNLERSKSYRFAQHNVLIGKPRLEAIAPDLDTISFNMRFDLALGIDPASELIKLGGIIEAGAPQALVVGDNMLGLFVVEKLSEDWRRIDGRGQIIVASVSLQLKEYAE